MQTALTLVAGLLILSFFTRDVVYVSSLRVLTAKNQADISISTPIAIKPQPQTPLKVSISKVEVWPEPRRAGKRRTGAGANYATATGWNTPIPSQDNLIFIDQTQIFQTLVF